MPIDPYKRYQTGLSINELYPYRTDGLCRCGCGKPVLPPKKCWASKECSRDASDKYFIIAGNVSTIRWYVYERDKGICAKCEKYDEEWQADHIVEVRHGGGGRGLENYQTLCLKCHKAKTKESYSIGKEEEKTDGTQLNLFQ